MTDNSKWSNEDYCLAKVEYDGRLLKNVINQTENLCLVAVRQNGRFALQYVKHQTEKICKVALRQNGNALQFVKNQTEELCKLAVI